MRVFFIFCAAHLPVKRDIKTIFAYFLFWTCMSEIRNRENRGSIAIRNILILPVRGPSLYVRTMDDRPK